MRDRVHLPYSRIGDIRGRYKLMDQLCILAAAIGLDA